MISGGVILFASFTWNLLPATKWLTGETTDATVILTSFEWSVTSWWSWWQSVRWFFWNLRVEILKFGSPIISTSFDRSGSGSSSLSPTCHRCLSFPHFTGFHLKSGLYNCLIKKTKKVAKTALSIEVALLAWVSFLFSRRYKGPDPWTRLTQVSLSFPPSPSVVLIDHPLIGFRGILVVSTLFHFFSFRVHRLHRLSSWPASP